MKLKMSNFLTLCSAIDVMQKHGVSGMAKYVWDLNNATISDRYFFTEQIEKIKKKYGKLDESCEELKELLESETQELPTLPREKIELLDKYPLLPIQYGLMLELVKEDKNNGESNSN